MIDPATIEYAVILTGAPDDRGAWRFFVLTRPSEVPDHAEDDLKWSGDDYEAAILEAERYAARFGLPVVDLVGQPGEGQRVH